MAEIKSIIFGGLFIVAVLCFGATLFTQAIVLGGWSTEYPKSFQNAQTYLNRSSAVTANLANQTANVGNTPASTDPTLTYGTILTTGMQLLTIPFDMANIIIGMLIDVATNPMIGGFIPGWFILVAIMFISLLVIVGVIGAVAKWWL